MQAPIRFVGFGTTMTPHHVALALGANVPGVAVVSLHPKEAESGAEVKAALSPFDGQRVRVVLLGLFWTEHGISAVKSWAAEHEGCTVDDTSCHKDRPTASFAEVLVSFAYETDKRLGVMVAGMVRKHADTIRDADDRINGTRIVATDPFFTGMLFWDADGGRSDYERFVEYFSGTDESFTREAVEAKGRAIAEANRSAMVAHIRDNAIRAILPFKGRMVKCIVFVSTANVRLGHLTADEIFGEDPESLRIFGSKHDITIACTWDLKKATFQCSFSSDMHKSGLAKEIAEYFGGGGNPNSAGVGKRLPDDYKLPAPLDGLIWLIKSLGADWQFPSDVSQ
ncbi:hypothetical protein QKT49_gp229 [Acanthamoeba castellanii medusavirus]|uniref:Uncharacterized protein n=1 Tax=Acanthamoeba castellanii medusavirus J1 TaxID=3114988 RepID=A0A3T1CXI1_9VIRU|nr:hypothetical protein QKT49_gp229 [Acanthamoeba castellanii medusavirus]BBI30534.1 hypothetical protein [Acanthamoeba castellanii medusavirus J1]